MTKAIIPGLIFVILLAMASQKSKSNSPKRKFEVKIKDTIFGGDTMKKFIRITQGSSREVLMSFHTDTTEVTDSYRNLKVRIIYPHLVADSLWSLGQLAKNEIDSKLHSLEYAINDTNQAKILASGMPNFFEAYPDHFYEDGNIASVRMIISTYLSGSAHPITNYITINYDKIKRDRFFETDFFDVKTKKDSDLLVNSLEKKFGGLSACRTEGESLWRFYKLDRPDFSFKRDSIIFNFDDNTLGQGPSMLDCKISRNELSSIIKENYK